LKSQPQALLISMIFWSSCSQQFLNRPQFLLNIYEQCLCVICTRLSVARLCSPIGTLSQIYLEEPRVTMETIRIAGFLTEIRIEHLPGISIFPSHLASRIYPKICNRNIFRQPENFILKDLRIVYNTHGLCLSPGILDI
jgi:hypothetical protein